MSPTSHKNIERILPKLFCLLAILLASLITVQSGSSTETPLSISYSSFGSFLSGFGTTGLLFLAIYQIPFELEKFREQQRQNAELEIKRQNAESERERQNRIFEKIELVAAEVLEATYRITNAILHITNPFSYSGEGGSQELTKKLMETNSASTLNGDLNAEIFIKMYNSRIETTKADIEFFYQAKIKAKVFLSEKSNNILGEIDKCYKMIKVNATMHSLGLKSRHITENKTYIEAYENFFDIHNKRKDFLDKKQIELAEELGKIIRPSVSE